MLAAAVLSVSASRLGAAPLESGAFERRVPLAPGGKFAIANVNGNVRVEGWEREEVLIRAAKSAVAGSRLDLERVQIIVEHEPGAVRVRTEYPDDDGVEVRVSFTVRVPYRVLLEAVETVNGSVTVRGVEGQGKLRSVNGNVEVFDSAGSFAARTTNGNIRMELQEFAAAAAAMSLETVNGSVILALPAETHAVLDVSSKNGDFHSELPFLRHGAGGARELRGILGRGGVEIKVRTVNGGIRVVRARPSV
jgi:hypothetical protein